MKSIVSLVAAAGAAALLSSCVIVEPVPVGPGYPSGGGGGYHDHDYGNSGGGSNWSEARRQARREGYEAGQSDARRGYSSNVNRHRGDVRPALFDEFASGYYEGYRAGGHDHGRPDYGDNDGNFGPETYRNGYRYGKLDAERHRSPNYRRYDGQYKPKFESSFREGYEKGYRENASHHGGSWR